MSQTVGISLIRYLSPGDNPTDSEMLRLRYVAQGFVELAAHILDVALGALAFVAAAFTLFQIPDLNRWAFAHLFRIQYLLSRPFMNFLTARAYLPDFEKPKAQEKDELKLPICSPHYTLAILEPAGLMIKAGIESDYFFGKHVFTRVIGVTAGVTALVVLVGEKVLGVIAALFALALGNNKFLNYHAYDLLKIHEGFVLVPYFLYFGIISPVCCTPQEKEPLR